MQEIYNKVCNEIDAINKVGITRSNLPILGQLVDIAKDIENINYWRGSSLDSKIGELMNISEDLKHTDSAEMREMYSKHVDDLLHDAEKLKGVLMSLNISPEMSIKLKNIYG
jgi:hypothetical protein